MVDPVGAMSRAFRDGTKEAPYPLLMNCLNRLLKDPINVVPLPPSEDLKQFFRAVCMAVDLGIADPQGRGEDRKREFLDHVYPVWKEALSEAEFQPFQEIVDGKVRQRIDQEKKQKQESSEPTPRPVRQARVSEESEAARHQKFARLMEQALREVGDEEEAEEAAAQGSRHAPAPEPAAPEITPAAAQAKTPTAPLELPLHADTSEELANTISSGDAPLRYSSPKERTFYAQYYLRGEQVTVQLVKSVSARYCVVVYPHGYAQRTGAGVVARNQLAEMGYTERKPLSYEKTVDHRHSRVKLTSTTTSVARRREAEFTPNSLAQTVRWLDGELLRVIHRLEAAYRTSAAPEEAEDEDFLE